MAGYNFFRLFYVHNNCKRINNSPTPFWDLRILQNLMVQQSSARGEISPDGQSGK